MVGKLDGYHFQIAAREGGERNDVVGLDFLFDQVEDDACAGHSGRDTKLGKQCFICRAVYTGNRTLDAEAFPCHLAHDEVIFILARRRDHEVALPDA